MARMERGLVPHFKNSTAMDGGSALSRQVYASVVLGAVTPERTAETPDHVASTAAQGRTTVFFVEHQPDRTTTRTIGQLQQPQALEMQRVERHPSRGGGGGAPACTMTGLSSTSTQVALRTVPVTLRNGQRIVNVFWTTEARSRISIQPLQRNSASRLSQSL